MNKFLKIMFLLIVSFNFVSLAFAVDWNGWSIHWRYQDVLSDSINVTGLKEHLDPAPVNSTEWWWKTISNFVLNILSNIVIPLAISVWVVMWIIWAYKLLFSSDEKQIASWLKMVVFWIIWIIIMMSARYIWAVLFEDIFNFEGQSSGYWLTWIQLSKQLYDKIAYPFIKIALYLALAVIFIILVWKSISLITKSDWTSHKKALTMIGRCAVSILIIIWAKNIVEAIYWKQEQVFNVDSPENLWAIWSWILADNNIPIVYNVVTRILSILSLVIFLLILVQWFRMLINPSKVENVQKLWKSLLYTLIWLFIIWVWYLLTNAFILN